jgi:hypothetical protein
MDERFVNAFEHVEHTYRIIKAGLHPKFWYFADLTNSDKYIQEQARPDQSSSIRKTEEWKRNFQNAIIWYKQKHGFGPTETPDTSPEEVLKDLERIQNNYARKVL